MTETKKKIDDYKLKVRTTSKGTDYIEVEVKVDDNLHNLIKSISLSDMKDARLRIGQQQTGEDDYFRYRRHLVKKWIYNSMYGDEARDVVFSHEIIESAMILLKFSSVDRIESFVSSLKKAIKTLIEVYKSYDDVEFTTTFHVGEDPKEKVKPKKEVKNDKAKKEI